MTISRRKITKYIGYLVVMILLSLSTRSSDINVASCGFYIALMFAGEGIIPTTAIYVLSTIITNPCLKSLITCLGPAILMPITRLILAKLRHRMSIYIATISGVVSMLPILILDIVYTGQLIKGIFMIVLTAIFTYLSIVAVFALVVKGLRYRLAIDEVVSFLVLLVIMSMGIYNIDIYGFKIYYTLMALMVLVGVSVLPPIYVIIIGFCYGIGGGIMGQNLELAGIICLMTLISLIFIRYNRYFSVVSLVAIDMVGGVYFDAFTGYTYLHIIALAIGVIIYLIIPKKKIKYLHNIYCDDNKSTALTTYINRNRIDVNAKITALASLFKDIEAEMTKGEYILTQNGAKMRLSERVMCGVCATCPNKETCFKALGGDTLSQIAPLVDVGMQKSVTSDDATTFLKSRCIYLPTIIDMTNRLAEQYSEKSIHICNVLDNKRILGEEIGSVSNVLSKLSLGILEGVSSDSNLEERIKEELSLHGVICHDVLAMQNKSGDMEITLVVREKDKHKRCTLRVLQSLVKMRLDRLEDRVCEIDGFCTLRFVPSSRYAISYGVSTVTKEGSNASGDSYSIVKLSHSKVAIVLCDGKGSGERAKSNSNNTIAIIEKMYKAGFDSDTILSFSNRLLSIRDSEDFCALDMLVIDLDTGSVDFIKLGGVTSYIKRANSIDEIEGSALPLGVVSEVTPSVSRRVLGVGDTIIVVSDGVTDAINDDVIPLLLNTSACSSQKIADDITSKATENGAIDDTTCIAIQLVKL